MYSRNQFAALEAMSREQAALAKNGNGTLLDGVLAGRSRGMEATQAVYPFKGRMPNCSSDLAEPNNTELQ
jgi:hypothetical protein